MSAFWLELTLSNVCVSSALALVAYAVHRHGRHPLLAHALWLGVLLKLVTPPVLTVPLIPFEGPALSAELARVEEQLASLSTPVTAGAEIGTLSLIGADEATTTMTGEAPPLRGAAGWTWLLGSALALAISLFRVVQFHVAMRRATTAAPPEVQGLSDRVSRSLGLRRSPPVLTTTARITPYVWWFGGPPQIVVPSPLVKSLPPAQLQLVLAHELAHIRRRDHWVRWVEWLSGVAFWWNPVTWWARRHLRANEELACDAVVLSTLQPDQRRYASSLLAVAEFLSTEGLRPPLVASTLTSGEELEARLTMILSNRLPRTPRWLLSASLALGVFCLPMSVAYAQDFEAVQRRLASAVEAGELTPAQARTMMEALRRASTDRPADASVDQRALRERYATMEQRVEAGIKSGKITREQGAARLAEARRSMFGDAPKDKVDADQRAKRERYAEYERGLMERVRKGAMTKDEANAKLEEAREKMFGGAEEARRGGEADEKAMAARYEELERRIKAAVESGRITEEQGMERLQQAKERMSQGAKKGAETDKPGSGEAKADQAALRARYAEYEKRLKAAVDKGEMTADEAEAKLKEARAKMFSDRR